MGWRTVARLMEADIKRGARLRVAMKSHRSCEVWEPACWTTVAEAPRPAPVHVQELEAKRAFAAYTPSLWDQLVGTAAKERKAHHEAVLNARFHDGALSQLQLDEWEWSTTLARRILHGDTDAYALALDYLAPFQEAEREGIRIAYRIPSSTTADARAVIPRKNDEQDLRARICAQALDLSRVLFAYLPVEVAHVEVVVGETTETWNPDLSVRFTRKKLGELLREASEPHAAVRRFDHLFNHSAASAEISNGVSTRL